jgi:thiosulfate/3-mercaptopyruvate sulfurtransferase
MQLDPAHIEAAVGIEAGSEVVAYCHSGSRSAIAAQMLRALGYDARNYVGSWHEWSRHDDLPLEL